MTGYGVWVVAPGSGTTPAGAFRGAAMPSPTEIVRRHVEAALSEGATAGIAADQIGRTLLDVAAEVLGRDRSPQEVEDEMMFIARNIADADDKAFMTTARESAG